MAISISSPVLIGISCATQPVIAGTTLQVMNSARSGSLIDGCSNTAPQCTAPKKLATTAAYELRKNSKAAVYASGAAHTAPDSTTKGTTPPAPIQNGILGMGERSVESIIGAALSNESS